MRSPCRTDDSRRRSVTAGESARVTKKTGATGIGAAGFAVSVPTEGPRGNPNRQPQCFEHRSHGGVSQPAARIQYIQHSLLHRLRTFWVTATKSLALAA